MESSVKALTQFPSVLGNNMAKNLSWTSTLGETYGTQAADAITVVQVLRAKAQADGNGAVLIRRPIGVDTVTAGWR